MKKALKLLLVLLLLAAFVSSAWKVYTIVGAYAQAEESYEELAELTEPVPEPKEETSVPDKPEPEILWPQVDFESLSAINPDIIGWIIIEDTNINYPVVQGEDNDFYYDIKIQAAMLLKDNVEDTFVTPVFNGSASLRNAAGQMIEEVKKSARRGDVIDEAYLEKLFSEMTSLYRLDQISTAEGKADLGPLPATSKALLITLALVWVGMGIYVGCEAVKKKKQQRG